ncbi:CRISPR-associated protein Csx20 [Fervidibacillus halotolerans]|uniref:CRISPR-associated protein Csx20 n=1 Tax=Fervidibacillus halotolerans TaxID=2980027 RepID=A0A9E8LYA3_9BACI|nr:CRISPR-associated protein Csx20 [Fervidibacillus halotolerans]WAA11978.1 CRISPR-associated protein Csx20 [Fervidibacillus halotolerans]
MKIYAVISHSLSPEQIHELEKRFHPEEIICIPEQYKRLWMNISPTGDWNHEWLIPIINWLKDHLNNGDIVIVQGEYGATYSLVSWLRKQGYSVYYATTERQVIETIKEDGTVITQRTFKHVNFRKYVEYE